MSILSTFAGIAALMYLYLGAVYINAWISAWVKVAPRRAWTGITFAVLSGAIMALSGLWTIRAIGAGFSL